MADKTQSQTYNFLLENKSIKDIKQQPNIEVIEKSRHGGSTFKIIQKINDNDQQLNDDLSENIDENLEIVATNLTDNEKDQKNNNYFWTKLTHYLNWPTSNAEELIQVQRNIQELENEIQQLKKENEELKLKESSVNVNKFKYNAVTIYDEKQIKKTGINKIHEEILSINNEIYYIITFVHIDNYITEKILYFDYYKNNDDLQVINQTKKYQNINEYKNDFSLFENTLINKNNLVFSKMTIKAFLKQHNDLKLKPTKTEKWIWNISVVLPTIALIIGIFHPPGLIVGGIGLALKTCTSIFSSATRKVDAWFGNKFYKSKDQKDKEKKERQSIIKNLTSDKLETKLQTQYDILKEELDNKKDMKTDQLISNSTINHNSNSILENSSIEPLKPDTFDSSIRNTVNNQELQPSTISRNNWNKVECLLT